MKIRYVYGPEVAHGTRKTQALSKRFGLTTFEIENIILRVQ